PNQKSTAARVWSADSRTAATEATLPREAMTNAPGILRGSAPLDPTSTSASTQRKPVLSWGRVTVKDAHLRVRSCRVRRSRRHLGGTADPWEHANPAKLDDAGVCWASWPAQACADCVHLSAVSAIPR